MTEERTIPAEFTDTLRCCQRHGYTRVWRTLWRPEGEEDTCPECGQPGETPPPLIPTADQPPVPNSRLTDKISNPSLIELDVRAKTYDLMVLETARERVRAKLAGEVELPWVRRLDSFLATPDDDVTHRVAGLWPSGGRVVLSAANKAGKTTMVGNLLRSLVDGEPFLDHFGVERAGRVVLIDNELDENMLRRWLREQNITTTAAVDVVPLRGQLSAFDVLNPSVRTRFAELLGTADVLIFDCLRPALDALGLSEDKDAGRFLEALDELAYEAGIDEVFVVHHMGHSAERSRGDSRILDWPDAVWKLVRDIEDDEDDQATSRRYFTAYGRDVDQPETLLSFEPATRRLSVAGGSRQDTRADRLVEAVCEYLADHPDASKNAIEKAIEGKAADVRKSLARAVEQGLVTVRAEGRAHLHTLNSSHSSLFVPTNGRTPSQRFVRSSYKTDELRRTTQEDPQADLVPDEPTCQTCGEPLDEAAQLSQATTCTSCEMQEVAR